MFIFILSCRNRWFQITNCRFYNCIRFLSLFLSLIKSKYIKCYADYSSYAPILADFDQSRDESVRFYSRLMQNTRDRCLFLVVMKQSLSIPYLSIVLNWNSQSIIIVTGEPSEFHCKVVVFFSSSSFPF